MIFRLFRQASDYALHVIAILIAFWGRHYAFRRGVTNGKKK